MLKVGTYYSRNDSGFSSSDWNFDRNPIVGYNKSLSFNDPMNQLALKYARSNPAWHDWILGPNYIISGPAINTPILNSQKRWYLKLDKMQADGFYIDPLLYFQK